MSSDGIQQLAKGQCDRGDIGVCSVIVEPNGERTFYKHHGVERNGFLDQNSISSLVECDGDFILASGYTFELTKQRESALSAWRNLSKQAITIFDPSPVHNRLEQQYLNEILACSSWVSLSENEALEITRRTSTAEASISLADHGPNVVVRSGARGAFVALANSKKAECIPTISVVAVDTTAAGETHIGVMAHALSRGATVPSAVRLANIAAALSTTRHGASTGPHLEALYAAISAVPGVDQTLGKLLR